MSILCLYFVKGETAMPTIIDKLAWIYIESRRLLSTRSKGKDTYYTRRWDVLAHRWLSAG